MQSPVASCKQPLCCIYNPICCQGGAAVFVSLCLHLQRYSGFLQPDSLQPLICDLILDICHCPLLNILLLVASAHHSIDLFVSLTALLPVQQLVQVTGDTGLVLGDVVVHMDLA